MPYANTRKERRLVALVSTVAYLGLEARGVEVQCQVASGLPGFHLVGLPDKAVNESRQRVQAAMAATPKRSGVIARLITVLSAMP